MPDGVPGYWYSRFLFERALALVYLVTPEDHRRTGEWWARKRLGLYFPVISLAEAQSGAP